MVLKKQKPVLWERAHMPIPPDYVWPWSTWVGLRRRAEEQAPHNMTLLMQHAYAKNPVVGCWKMKKVDADPREAEGRRTFIQRKFIPKNYVTMNRLICPEFTTPPRFIMTRFKNIAHRVDDRWEKCPLDEHHSRTPLTSQRRAAVSFDKKTSDAIRGIIWKKTKCGKCAEGACDNLSHHSQSTTTPEPRETEIK